MALEANKYPKEKTIVDISHHNSDIDFDKAKEHVSMFIARTGDGHRYNSNGELQGVVDRKYKTFVANMKARGIPFGNYMFNRFSGVASAKQEAEFFWNYGDKDATVWVCDAEVSTAPNMKECIQVFIDRLKELGAKKVGLYIGHHKYQEFGGKDVNCDFTWIPRYGNKPSFACDLWQWTEYGNIAGIGKCDINVLYGDKPMSFFTEKEGAKETLVPALNKVVTYEVGTNLIPTIQDKLAFLGYEASINFTGLGDGLVNIETSHQVGAELDKLTAWLDEQGWAYYYTTSKEAYNGKSKVVTYDMGTNKIPELSSILAYQGMKTSIVFSGKGDGLIRLESTPLDESRLQNFKNILDAQKIAYFMYGE